VNDILSMPLWVDTNEPVYPNPVTIFTTPAGNPALLKICPSIKAVNGVCSAGFKTIVHPAANAGATFQAIISRG
jgi:hypothetical protein